MCSILKSTVRFGLVAVIVGGGVVALAGPDRIGALLHQTRDNINASIDRVIDDPVALRAKVKNMAAQYPKRIAAVQRDYDEVAGQIAQLEREIAVSQRVVSLADRDLRTLDSLIARVEQRQDEVGAGAIVKVRLDDRVVSSREAYAKASTLTTMRQSYDERAGELQRELGYLTQQRDRLGELLAQLQSEHTKFQAQLFEIDRKIDAAERNKRLISMIEDRQERIDQHARYKAVSLAQFTRELDRLRSEQEATLDRLTGTELSSTYEDRARYDLSTHGADEPEPIELDTEIIEPQAAPATPRRLSSRGG